MKGNDNMGVILESKPIQTSRGIADGMKLGWTVMSLLLIAAPKGFLACCIFDLETINQFDKAAALVGSPDNIVGTLDNMVAMNLSKVNEKAAALGLKPGMGVMEALELLF